MLLCSRGRGSSGLDWKFGELFRAALFADAVRNDELAAVPKRAALIAVGVNDQRVRGAHAGGAEADLFAPGAKADDGISFCRQRGRIIAEDSTDRRIGVNEGFRNRRSDSRIPLLAVAAAHGLLSIPRDELASRGGFSVNGRRRWRH